MGRVELVVGPVMSGCGDWPGRRCRADHFVVPGSSWGLPSVDPSHPTGEGGGELDADFKIDDAVQVNRDKAACPLDFLGADDVPYDAAGFGHDLWEIFLAGAAAHYGQRHGGVLFEPDVVVHAQAPFGFRESQLPAG